MKIVIVDDHPLTCAGLKMFLETSFPASVVSSCHSSSEARQWLDLHEADWLFLDIRLPDDPHYQLFEWLRANGHATRVILISAEIDVALVRTALEAGVRGYIAKSAEPEELLRGFAAIRAGDIFLPERLRTQLSESGRQENGFSPRKQLVYQMLLKGLSNKAIARDLNLSEYTVKEYVSAIFASRGVANRLELILKDGAQQKAAGAGEL